MKQVNFTPLPPFEMSQLNIETTRRYEACLARGGHVASDRIVLRDIGVLDNQPMAVCERCDVPFVAGGTPRYNRLRVPRVTSGRAA